MKIEEGVMVMKDGKAWGVSYKDGYSTSYGWIDPCDAKMSKAEFCKKPTDVTWDGSHYTQELLTGKVVKVKRTTTLEIQD